MEHKSIRTLVGASRPSGWAIFSIFALFGLFASGGTPSPMFAFQLSLMSFPMGLVVFGLNDVYDCESDALNPRKGGLEGIRLDPGDRWLVTRAAMASAALLETSALMSRSGTNLVGMTVALAVAWAYSAPPLRLKERPPFDSLANGAILFGSFLVGFSYALPISRMYPRWYLIVLAVAGVHAYSTIMDCTPDSLVGDRTFAIAFGKRTAALVALFSVIPFFISLRVPGYLRSFLLLVSLIFLISSMNPSETLARALFKVLYVVFLLVGVGLAIAVLRA